MIGAKIQGLGRRGYRRWAEIRFWKINPDGSKSTVAFSPEGGRAMRADLMIRAVTYIRKSVRTDKRRASVTRQRRTGKRGA